MKGKVDKKKIIYATGFFMLIFVFIMALFVSYKENSTLKVNILEGTVVASGDNLITIEDDYSVRYTIDAGNIDAVVGEDILIKYTGLLDAYRKMQDIEVIDYTIYTMQTNNSIPAKYNDNGIFSDYYSLAYNKLKEMSLDEKIGQILLVRYPDSNQKDILKQYGLAGYVFFEKDFKDKTKKEVQDMMNSLQEASKIPILTAIDEEGGKVVRVSSNTNLRDSKFKSSQELYSLNGMNAIKEDTKDKSSLLKNLGINLNLAPVVDVSTNSSDYMYERTIGENSSITSEYAKTVIEASKGTGVSYTLKHFPGYGNNSDTHTGSSIDTRSLDDIKTNDLPPFEAGIKAGSEAVLVSHNTVNSIDSSNPASLSLPVHNILRNDLSFTGVIITDDLAMGATSSIADAVVKAVKAGNDLIITTDYKNDINTLKSSISSGVITEEQIDEMVFRVLAWKYYKGIMFTDQK